MGDTQEAANEEQGFYDGPSLEELDAVDWTLMEGVVKPKHEPEKKGNMFVVALSDDE